MNPILRKIKFLLKSLLNFTLAPLFSFFIRRNEEIWIFNSLNKNNIAQNTKFLYLHLNNKSNSDILPIWITENKKIVESLKKKGYNAYNKNSLKGIYYILKAKYFIVDSHFSDISRVLSHKAISINLWHGIPLKKISYDDPKDFISKLSKYEKFFYNLFNKFSTNYYISCGEYDSKKFKTAFKVNFNEIISLGSPRNDSMFKNFKNQDIFMEEDIKYINKLKKEGKKLLFYVPTFRDTGRSTTEWLNSKDLEDILNRNNAMLFYKLHPYDKNDVTIQNSLLYQLSKISDLYSILKEIDCLITDYSSVYFDYLLLDRPIIFYPFDLKEYIAQDRPLYVDYDEYTPGRKAYNEDELINAIQRTINGEDNYKQARAKIRNEVFLHQDGNACERIVEFVKNLDK